MHGPVASPASRPHQAGLGWKGQAGAVRDSWGEHGGGSGASSWGCQWPTGPAVCPVATAFSSIDPTFRDGGICGAGPSVGISGVGRGHGAVSLCHYAIDGGRSDWDNKVQRWADPSLSQPAAAAASASWEQVSGHK